MTRKPIASECCRECTVTSRDRLLHYTRSSPRYDSCVGAGSFLTALPPGKAQFLPRVEPAEQRPTLRMPCLRSCSAARALVASLGQVQNSTISPSRVISLCRGCSSSGEIWSAPGRVRGSGSRSERMAQVDDGDRSPASIFSLSSSGVCALPATCFDEPAPLVQLVPDDTRDPADEQQHCPGTKLRDIVAMRSS